MDAQALAKTQNEYTRIQRGGLLEALKKNLVKHQEEYAEAVKGWEKALIDSLSTFIGECQDHLEDLVENGPDKDDMRGLQRLSFYPNQPPVDHSDDYKKIIQRMTMSIDSEIWLSHLDFDRFVMDNWEWKEAHTASVAAYNNR